MKQKLIKKLSKYATMPLALVVLTTNVYGLAIHKHTTQHMVANGVTYELNRKVTSRGLLDVHVIRVDMESPGITVGPAMPVNPGARRTTSGLLMDNGAIAGINADFFDMRANPVSPMGQVVHNGEIVSINQGEDGYATFFVDTYNNPFIKYVRPEIIFLNNGYRNIAVQSINKFESSFSSALFDRQAIYNTAGLDARFDDLVKLVIEDDVITYISYPGETVDVPENGYVIVLSLRYAMYFIETINVGDTAELSLEATVDFDNINSAIGGAGTILKNGSVSNSGFVVAPSARHPRSAIGISKDQTEVILVAVDGRSHSIGATHQEMATIMLGLGAYNAMHLDGGGSTTMAVQTVNDDHVRVVNTVSDGSQRQVVNAIGVYNHSQPGVLASVAVNTYPRQVFYGGGVNVYPIGLDGHLSRIPLNWEYVTLTSSDTYGTWEGNRFYPSTTGEISFTLTYKDFTYTTSVQSLEIASITPQDPSITVSQGQRIPLNFTGTSTMGHTSSVLGLDFEVFPSSLGHFENNVFVVTGNQPGYIRASIGDVSTYIGVNFYGQNSVQVPVATAFTNPFRANLQSAPTGGSFDITLVGNVTAAEDVRPYEYLEIQNRALNGFMASSSKGVFAGHSDISNIPGMHLGRWSTGYSFTTFNNVALVSLNASRGTLTATSVYNWSFVNEAKNSNADHVIIKMNRQPSSLASAAERQAFEDAVEDIAASGKNVFVVSTEGVYNTATIKNGVNYINMGSLFRPDGSVNNNFAILRFRVNGDTIHFDIQNAF